MLPFAVEHCCHPPIYSKQWILLLPYQSRYKAHRVAAGAFFVTSGRGEITDHFLVHNISSKLKILEENALIKIDVRALDHNGFTDGGLIRVRATPISLRGGQSHKWSSLCVILIVHFCDTIYGLGANAKAIILWSYIILAPQKL